jgi:methylphosphotriester-DNA--protein-cysteine methyltransferase
MGTNWSAPTDFDLVCKRAAGRRRYNAERQAEAQERFKLVLAAILPPEGRKRGTQEQLARALGVHPSTISRDVKKWKRTLLKVMEQLKALRQSKESEEVAEEVVSSTYVGNNVD